MTIFDCCMRSNICKFNIKFVLIEFRPEEKIRQLEKKVNELIEESCHANEAGDLELVSQ